MSATCANMVKDLFYVEEWRRAQCFALQLLVAVLSSWRSCGFAPTWNCPVSLLVQLRLSQVVMDFCHASAAEMSRYVANLGANMQTLWLRPHARIGRVRVD